MAMLKLAVLIAVVLTVAGFSAVALSSRTLAIQAENPKAASFAGLNQNAKELVSTVITSVYSRSAKPLEGALIYSHGILKCRTDQNGICRFDEKSGIHNIRVEFSGGFVEETREVEKGANTFSFEVEREFEVKIKVVNLILDSPAKGAEIQIDGRLAGHADSNGEFSIRLPEGGHTITASSIDSQTVVEDLAKDQEISFSLLEGSKRFSLGI